MMKFKMESKKESDFKKGSKKGLGLWLVLSALFYCNTFKLLEERPYAHHTHNTAKEVKKWEGIKAIM